MALEQYFPNLATTGYTTTSAATFVYNCIAWAAGVTDDWWWPDPMGVSTWPASATRAETITAFEEAFQSLGYTPGADDRLEPGFEKVALYALGGMPKHAARQLPNGLWTSKLGELEDIEHTLEALNGAWYGAVVSILKRPRSSA
ncbi:MAG TPA: hypothetical protein VFA18_14550 [Gemmataceae bacterium]|nr:hypothetical protein [Gemmataceae bacterium]